MVINPENFSSFSTRFSELKRLQPGEIITLEGIEFIAATQRIHSDSEEIMNTLSGFLMKDKHIEIELWGHTYIDGGLDYNIRLSQARATSVKNILIKFGIAGSRISAKGFGYSQPLCTLNTRIHKTMNNRIEVFRTK